MNRLAFRVMSPHAVILLLAIVLPVSSFLGHLGEAAGGIEVFYAPEDLPLDRLLQLYRQAKRYIYVSVYGMTSPAMVKTLVEARKRGVDVRVITDSGRLDDPKQKTALEALRLAGVPIKVSQHDGLMHLKQVVIDDEVNASGSMNHTTSGNRYNDERLDLITDPHITTRARQKFLAMWADRVRYADWK